jgi:hypothetical protein
MASVSPGNCWTRCSGMRNCGGFCGWRDGWQVPSESTFSRAFDEFAQMELAQFVHEALIRETQQDRLIGHISRDSTAIEARERFPKTASPKEKEKKKKDKQKGKKKNNKNKKNGKAKQEAAPAPPRARRKERKTRAA